MIIELTDSTVCCKVLCFIRFAPDILLCGLLLGIVHTTKTFPFWGGNLDVED